MSQHSLPQPVREFRGLVGVKSTRPNVSARFHVSPLTPGSRKWRALEDGARHGSGQALANFYDLHGKYVPPDFRSSRSPDVAPAEAA